MVVLKWCDYLSDMNMKSLKHVLKFANYVVTCVTDRFMLLNYLFLFHLYICYMFWHSIIYKLFKQVIQYDNKKALYLNSLVMSNI